ncbi:MAG TPA: type II toxin-antitoxin system PemK/MazF family toxin [Acidimicrobiales bacterium]|nr:type II toxin-antitoxin system PemK/MazF family toxin [Acidimicrobiales bacterium]
MGDRRRPAGRELPDRVERAPVGPTLTVEAALLAAVPCHPDHGRTPRRGELWWCELPDIGRRPVLVLSRDMAIPHLGRTLIAPCTTTLRGLPSEVALTRRAAPRPEPSGQRAG